MQYDNTNTGTLFKNDKATTEKHPTHTGKINVDGKDYRLAAWVKEGKNGKFFSLKISEFTKPDNKPQPKQGGFDDLDDSVPF